MSAVASLRFRPRLASTVAVAILLPLFVVLGFWQLRRADEKVELRETAAERAREPPVDLDTTALTGMSGLAWRPVRARGRWDAGHQVLLDNQVSDGQTGYLVFTPLRLDGSGGTVLVDRGWVPAGAYRNTRPDLRMHTERADVVGVAAPPPPAGLGSRPDVDDSLGPGVLRVERLDPAQLAGWLGVKLLPVTIRLDPAAPDGYRREWRMPGFGPQRHIAYAVQWFLFALILLGLFLRFSVRRE